MNQKKIIFISAGKITSEVKNLTNISSTML